MMLAQRGRVEDIARLQGAGYIFDLKIDGVRALVHIDDGEVALVSRTGVTFTSQYPEVVAALSKAFPTGSWELDGEIAVNDHRGLPSWPLTIKRNAQTKNTSGWAAKLPATFYAFDVLTANGVSIRLRPLAERRQVLADLDSDRVKLVLHSTDGPALWEVVEQHRLEGVIAKRPDAAYVNKRTSCWIKIKRTQTVSCLVGGTDPGTGSRARTFGNLHLYLIDDGRLVPVGKVGSGFSDKELDTVMRALHHPPMIVEVEYLDVSPDGQLRQPVFQRLRSDLAVDDCTIDQLA